MPNKIKQIVDGLKNDELWDMYSSIMQQLKQRGLVRTKNIIGERGESLVVEIYNNTPNEPNLQAAPEGTQNVDALSRKGERYSIKTVTLPNKITGVFYGLNQPESSEVEEKKFEYLIIVLLDSNLQPIKILEAGWETFLKFKKWHKTMRAWNISITKKFEGECRIII
ncbi:hypothetical protein ACFLQN_01535 [Candidatus Aenigmatarchaeota archaeon]